MLASLIQVFGAIAVSVGAGLIYLPAGIIIGGILAILIGISLERV